MSTRMFDSPQKMFSLDKDTSRVAVSIQNASKTFQNGIEILKNFNMEVRERNIYGLLGASGCGKTTVLSLIVHLKKLDEGRIRVFGKKPGTVASGIPGRTIGYMPQDTSLYETFTIQEIMHYYGRIYGMSRSEIQNRVQFLVKLLDLPPITSVIGNLSGGQQRRTSLSVAMIHEPKLLILDEPTAGVDPLLRERIWTHLYEATVKYGTTVIITTHYIDEAKQSDTIGILRNGRLLAEECPKALLKINHTASLESVFLSLSQKDEESKESIVICSGMRSSSDKSILEPVEGLNFRQRLNSYDLVNGSTKNNSTERSDVQHKFANCSTTGNNVDKILALTTRNFLNYLRYPRFTLLILFLPLAQIIMINLIIGPGPKYTSIGIINNEISDNHDLSFCKNNNQSGCFSKDKNYISCRFINMFSEEDITWVPFTSQALALESVQKGKTWGFISIPQNYTKHMLDRFVNGNFMSNETISETTLKIRLDFANQLKASFITEKLLLTFQTFVKNLAIDCGEEPRRFDLALKFNAVDGESSESSFKEYFVYGVLLSIIFLLPMASCANFIKDKRMGTLDRTLVAGVQYFHIQIAFLISEACLLIIQLVLLLTCLRFGFQFEIKGSEILFFMICFVQGLTGLSFGFLVGSICDNELEGIFLILSIAITVFVASGDIWPTEGLEKWTKTFCQILPSTTPLQALRSVVNHSQWGIFHSKIWPAFAQMAGWIILVCILSWLFRRIKSK